ncbi:uncharacterized protein LOC142983528 [Anticarsia gemmatalis]|uniref:uncharacterized protein LOC142983528 n=1 Tax=Anticarsia gemmatalis TaxID=129554 RepID=UPI003F773836
MAKFFKSIFHTTDRRKSTFEGEGEEEVKADTPPMDGRRQLSISRSGRMRQANKKRHSLTLELYGETIHIDAVEKPKSVEYHVHSPVSPTAPANFDKDNRLDDDSDIEIIQKDIDNPFQVSLENKLKALENGAKSPEEEIDNAFEIIDKS